MTETRDRLDVVAMLLLALAAVSTAWSSYQSNRWTGEQAKAAALSNRTRIEASRSASLANAQTTVDVATFSQWVDAYAHREKDLTAFYSKRFRAEFKPAFAAWVASRPLQNANAPLTPFAMPQYRLAAKTQADALDAKADALAGAARRDIQRSSNYVLAVVLFAVALFFAGMSTKLNTRAMRAAMLTLGCVIFLVAIGWVASLPISLSV